MTPQDTVLDPTTIYGVTKVAGEHLCDYYVRKYGLDVRGCRFPGIISHQTPPGGGTTDYAVAIFYEAVRTGRYTCFLHEDTRLPMMYMPDCLKCTLDLMDADFSRLRHHSDFNVTAMSFTAGELAAEIRKHIPASRSATRRTSARPSPTRGPLRSTIRPPATNGAGSRTTTWPP